MRTGMHTLRAKLYIGAVAVGGGAILVLSLRNVVQAGIGHGFSAWIALALLTILVGRLTVPIPLSAGCRLSFADSFIVLSLLLFGLDHATLIGALEGFFSSQTGRGTATKKLFNTTGLAIAVNLSARLYVRMVHQGSFVGTFDWSPLRFLMAIVLLTAVQQFINTALVAGVLAVTAGVSGGSVWQRTYPWVGAGCVAGGVAAFLVFGVDSHAGIHSALAILTFPVTFGLAFRAQARRKRDPRLPKVDGRPAGAVQAGEPERRRNVFRLEMGQSSRRAGRASGPHFRRSA
jgi:hypothetical protein